MQRRIALSLLAFLFVLLYACFQPVYTYRPVFVDKDKPTLMIAILKGAHSEYKDLLIKEITESYGKTYNVFVKSVRNMKDLENDRFDYMIVMEQNKAWLWMNRGLKNIARQAKKDRTVYVITSGDKKWRWKRDDLHLICSASEKVNIEPTMSLINTIIPLR